jgi:uncharacterized membrane protein
MDPVELGIDRTVVSMWAPDDTWPALLDDYAEADVAIATSAGNRRLGSHSVGGGGAMGEGPSGSDTAAASGRTDLDVPPAMADVVAPIPSEPDLRTPVEAVAAVDGHPLHPVIVPLPIGSFVGAFVSDLAYLRTGDRFWARGARLLTASGLATGLLAGSLGAIDFTGRRPIRRHPSAWVHAAGNLAVLGLAVGSLGLRGRDERAAIGKGGLAISASIATILLVTGWLGGELAYRERIGVIPT